MLKINFLGFREKTSFKTADQRCNIPSTVKHDYSQHPENKFPLTAKSVKFPLFF